MYQELPAVCLTATLEQQAGQIDASRSVFTPASRSGRTTLDLLLAPTDTMKLLYTLQGGVSSEIQFRVEVPGFKDLLRAEGFVTEIGVMSQDGLPKVRVKMVVSNFVIPREVT